MGIVVRSLNHSYFFEAKLYRALGQQITFFLMVEDAFASAGLDQRGVHGTEARNIADDLKCFDGAESVPESRVEKLREELRLWMTNVVALTASLEWLRVEFLRYIEADNRQVEAGGDGVDDNPGPS